MSISTSDFYRKMVGPWYPVAGFQTLTPATATGLTVPAGASFAYITVRTNDVRWRDDGTSPTTTVGMLLKANEVLVYKGDLSAIEFIDVGAASAVDVAYYA